MKDVILDEMSLSFHSGKGLPDVEKLILIKTEDNWIVGKMTVRVTDWTIGVQRQFMGIIQGDD